MNYFAAREIFREGRPTGLFHYTCMNDHRVWPVGYCGHYRKCEHCDGQIRSINSDPNKHCPQCGGTGAVILPENECCPGHKTKDEAIQHYQQYLVDQAVFYGPKEIAWPKYKCAVEGCDKEGEYSAIVPGHMYHFEFCSEHCAKEKLSELLRVGESCSS